ncbi:MAG TPA: methyltransferase [Thermoanaerobaculia bacterium]|nr:methyltransferase [Thermoanaerobaculia bacterium]
MQNDDESQYRGWRRPGPVPPKGIEPEPGESLDYLCGHFRIFQYEKGHRYSTDDAMTAWYATQWAPRVDRAADLGSGIGSVAILSAWRLPGATFCTVEAQEMSLRLARKSIQYNGLEGRFTTYLGDLRDETLLANEAPFDLVTGSPPYWPATDATVAAHPQAVPARIEVRGTVADYAAAASRILAPGGTFVFVFANKRNQRKGVRSKVESDPPLLATSPTTNVGSLSTLDLTPRQPGEDAGVAFAEEALRSNGLVLLRRRDIIFKEGNPPMISLFAAMRATDLPPGRKAWIEPPLIIRTRTGAVHPEYAAIRISFGFPPGDTAGQV